jgi:predicted dehydrogenase
MSTGHQVTRRSFLRSTGAAAGLAALSARSYAQVAGANDRLNMAFIGCGGIANSHAGALINMMKGGHLGILAVCDVYQQRARDMQERVKAAGGEPRLLRDYREILALPDVDYVLIATPEHWHAQQTLDALNAGKHVYCEKPMTHTIEQGQAVLAKARQTGLKLQVGVQGMSDDSYAAAHQAILAGKLGPVVEAQTDYVRNYKPEGPWRTGASSSDPKPPDLDWEAWLGPAARREWDARRYHDWRCYRDYSGGIATDLFVHRITRIIRACGLTFPDRVVGMGGIYLWPDGRDLPDNFEMLAEYPKVEGVTPGMTLRVLGTMANAFRSEHCIRGHNGTLIFTGNGWVIRNDAHEVVETHEKSGGEDIGLHHRNLHAAIREGAALNCPPELGLYGSAAVRMANESWFERKMMRWDPDKGAAVPA